MKPNFILNGFKIATVAALLSGTGACVQRPGDQGKMRELSYDPSAQNIALLFGAANGLPGIADDLESMKVVLEDPKGGNGFKVVMINEASTQQILDATRKAAVDAGENGTIFWYFSGHGAESGDLMTIGGMLPFAKVTDTIRDARQTPVKRFYAMFDSCFSGQMVDGSAAIDRSLNRSQYALTGGEQAVSSSAFLKSTAETYAEIAADSFHESSTVAKIAPQAYEQLIVVSASQRYEESLAGSSGSMFTEALKNVFKRMKSDSPNATIGQFLDAIKSETKSSSGGQHTPASRVMPEQGVLQDSLFIRPVRQQRQEDSVQPRSNAAPAPNGAPAIAVALGATDQASGSARVYVNLEAAIARVGLCSGRRDACVRTGSVFLEFRDAPSQTVFPATAGRKTLESAKPLKLAAAKPVTILGFDAAGKVVVSRTIQFRPR